MSRVTRRQANSLSSEVALRARCEQCWHNAKAKVHASLKLVRHELKMVLPDWSGVVLVVCLVGLSMVLMLQPSTLMLMVVLSVMLGVVGYFLHQYWQSYQRYAYHLNEQLYPILGDIFRYPVTHYQTATDHLSVSTVLAEIAGKNRVSHEEVVALVQHSMLFTDDVATYETDDVLVVKVDGRPVTIAELRLGLTQGDVIHARRSTVTLFSGLLVHRMLERPLAGQTYVSTEDDTKGFAHRTFWSALLGGSTVVETELESNAFERDLHVATSDPVEARYILTPDFMEQLHQWWQEHHQPIRLAFHGQDFFMLLPDTHMKLQAVPPVLTDARVIEYLYTIARPVWRTLRLVEDMRL